jgi:bifunctional ADP-heptose synthase (sugar kinase/adenylyltransferase)
MGLLVVTRGDEGCTVHGPEGEIHVPGLPVHAVDVTGAGDAFGAAFAHAYATTGDVSLAARFATAAGARATTRLGPQAGVATVGEIVACMEHHGIAGTDDARRLSSHQTAQSRPDAPRPGGAVDGHPARHGGAPAGIAGDRAPHHASSPWEKS